MLGLGVMQLEHKVWLSYVLSTGCPKKTGISGNRMYVQFVWHKCKTNSVITFEIDCSEWQIVVNFKRHQLITTKDT